MYYAVGMSNKKVCVRDTSDGVSEWVGIRDLRKLHRSGIKIEGIEYRPGGDGNFIDFGISVSEGRRIMESKYALGVGVFFKFWSSASGSLSQVDLRQCRGNCIILLDDVCSSICGLDIRYAGCGDNTTIKIGSGVSCSASPAVAVNADKLLNAVTFDISEAADEVFSSILYMLQSASSLDRVVMGRHRYMWLLEKLIFSKSAPFSVKDYTSFRDILIEDRELHERFLEKYKCALLTDDNLDCIVSRRDVWHSALVRKRLEKLRDFDVFIDFARLGDKGNSYAVEYLKGVKCGFTSLSSVWRYFYFGGDDRDIYDSLIKALSRLKVED